MGSMEETTDLASQVRAATLARRRVLSDAAAAKDQQYDLIRRAAAGGVRQNELVKITGMTRERIRQIVKGEA